MVLADRAMLLVSVLFIAGLVSARACNSTVEQQLGALRDLVGTVVSPNDYAHWVSNASLGELCRSDSAPSWIALGCNSNATKATFFFFALSVPYTTRR